MSTARPLMSSPRAPRLRGGQACLPRGVPGSGRGPRAGRNGSAFSAREACPWARVPKRRISHPRRKGNSRLMKYLPTWLHQQHIAPLPVHSCERYFRKLLQLAS